MGVAVGTATEVEDLLLVVEVEVVVGVEGVELPWTVEVVEGVVETCTVEVRVVDVPPMTVVERAVEREIGVLELELEPAPGVRYQLVSASPRHSPAVTPFQPFC